MVYKHKLVNIDCLDEEIDPDNGDETMVAAILASAQTETDRPLLKEVTSTKRPHDFRAGEISLHNSYWLSNH